jgi:hypothetical protein
MKNDGSAAAVLTAPPAETARLCAGIQFDDEGFSPEERELEATRQIIWKKLVARSRTEFSGTGTIRFDRSES